MTLASKARTVWGIARLSSSRRFTDTLVWQPERGVEPLAIDLGEYFRDVTGEG
jgi:hypothetical protein